MVDVDILRYHAYRDDGPTLSLAERLCVPVCVCVFPSHKGRPSLMFQPLDGHIPIFVHHILNMGRKTIFKVQRHKATKDWSRCSDAKPLLAPAHLRIWPGPHLRIHPESFWIERGHVTQSGCHMDETVSILLFGSLSKNNTTCSVNTIRHGLFYVGKLSR